jgi:dolichol-phosphate mannosyltransferase
MSRLLVMVPTYMEAGNIDAVVRRVRAALPGAHLLVIDDNSPDGTAAIAESAGRDVGEVTVLKRPAKNGLGDAYRAALAWALVRDFDVLITMDADLSHDPSALPGLVDACGTGVDLVVGSRYVSGASIETRWPRRRKALSRWANRYVRVALRTDVADNTTGYRVYRADLVRRIGLEHSTADGYAFQIEAIHRAGSIGATITEVPIVFSERVIGRSKISSRTIAEALLLVTWWGIRFRLGRNAVELDHAGAAS